MDIHQYLERIKYTGELQPASGVLSKLQLAHLMTVPFENLDIHNHIKIDLSNTFNKIVVRKRGGFCYELNGLFYQLLSEIGFEVKMVSARVFDPKKGYGPEFDHLAIIARIDHNEYLADVGFGEFSFYPLKIELNTEQNDPRGSFKIEKYDNDHLAVSKKNAAGELIPEYIFSEKERHISEFYQMCEYHQTSSESHFTQKRICSLPSVEGRVSLTGNILKITAGRSITERELKSEAEVNEVLWNYFNIRL